MSRGVRLLGPVLLGLGLAVPWPGLTDAMTPPADIRFWDAESVRSSFAKGGVLIETGDYKVHTSRRTTPGQIEIHTQDTDIIYVQEGSATFVLGGSIKDGRPTGPEEIRGTVLEGGTPRTIRKGDVVIVPAGVPHWFRDVQGPVLYYTVKVRSGGEVTR